MDDNHSNHLASPVQPVVMYPPPTDPGFNFKASDFLLVFTVLLKQLSASLDGPAPAWEKPSVLLPSIRPHQMNTLDLLALVYVLVIQAWASEGWDCVTYIVTWYARRTACVGLGGELGPWFSWKPHKLSWNRERAAIFFSRKKNNIYMLKRGAAIFFSKKKKRQSSIGLR